MSRPPSFFPRIVNGLVVWLFRLVRAGWRGRWVGLGWGLVLRGRISTLKMDILLLGCYTRFSCSLIKKHPQRAKIPIHPFIPTPPLIGWTNWPINEFHVRNLNWRQFSPRIFISIVLCKGKNMINWKLIANFFPNFRSCTTYNPTIAKAIFS